MPLSRLLLLVLPCTLLLSGCAPVVVVGAAAGAAVVHDRRTLGSMIDDQGIEMKAGAAIISDAALRRATRVSVTSLNGIVLLSGEATAAEDRDRILQIVRDINGVRRITNEIRLAEPAPLSSRSRDSLITSAVKSRLLVAPDINPTRVKVVTTAGAVYLMGIVTRAEGDVAADYAAGIEGVERVVKIFEYLD